MNRRMDALIVVLAFVLGPMALTAQDQTLHFHPGEWQIDSVTTGSGRTIHSSTHVCAKKRGDFWETQKNGVTCQQPEVQTVADGVSVGIHCVLSEGQIHSDIRSHVVETFARDGNSFTASGTSVTNTSYGGVRPIKATAEMHATAHRIGDCH